MRRTTGVWVIFYLLLLQLFMPAASAESVIPASMNYSGGAINTHDMMMLREKQRYLEEKNDYNDLQIKKNKKQKESVIEGEVAPSEKIYDEESSKKLKELEQQKSLENSQKKSRRFFRKKSKAIQEVTPASADKTVEKDETTTVIKTQAVKNEIVDGKIYVKAVGVTNSRVLTDEEIQILTDEVIGKYVTFDDLSRLIAKFNYLYATKGYITARAFLPPQTITDGIVRINLVEGLVGNVTVENNKYTSDSYIKKRISAKEDDIFQVVELEKDILNFNKYNNGIKIKANLEKGQKEGTTDIKLKAEEKFPFHVMGLMDNAGRKTIGELRGGLMMYSDSLFKQRDRLSLGAYTSRHSVTPFADYNIPVNKYDGRVGFLFSSSYAEIGEGPYKIFDIRSRSYNYSLYYTHPLIRKPNFELTSYSAINYKQASTDFAGYTINKDKITSFETSLNARLDTKRGIWYATQGVYQAFPIFDPSSRYFKYTGSIIRLHDFGHGIVGQFRGMYQYSPKDIMPYIDQFQAGGIATVRGYSEGLLIGRSGYILSGELMFPIAPQSIKVKQKKSKEKKSVPFLGRFVKGIVFVDHAGIYPYKGAGYGKQSYNHNDYMLSAGLGLRIALPGDASARLYWGFPFMRNSHETYYKNPRFSFEISLAPDFDKILQYKRAAREKKVLKQRL